MPIGYDSTLLSFTCSCSLTMRSLVPAKIPGGYVRSVVPPPICWKCQIPPATPAFIIGQNNASNRKR
jgi:hypothetical protein